MYAKGYNKKKYNMKPVPPFNREEGSSYRSEVGGKYSQHTGQKGKSYRKRLTSGNEYVSAQRK